MHTAAAETVTDGSVSLRYGVRTDVGRKRLVNEDSVLAGTPVFLVADGMGGHEAGDRASAAVLAEFRTLVGRTWITPDDIVQAVERAHRSVRLIAAGTRRGAGSTLTGIVLVNHQGRPHWLVLNVGDSRVYRLLGADLVQLSIDHSVAQEHIDNGTLDRADVGSFARRNVITRAMGADDSAADYWLRPVITGERLLVCSDGLTGELADETIRAAMTLNGETQRTADILLAHALDRGGRDNVSIIIVDVIAGGGDSKDGSTTGFDIATVTSTSTDGASVHGAGGGTGIDDDADDDTAEIPGRGGRASAIRR